MGHYLANFTVYTMAMTGLIFFAVFVYKKFCCSSFSKNSTKMLEIEETLAINPRKSLIIVRAGNEKFLIASDVDKTSLISKLQEEESISSYLLKKTAQSQNPKKQIDGCKAQIQMPPAEEIDYVPQPSTKKKIHLDPIDRTQKFQRKSRKTTNNTVILDFSQPNNHGFTAMKEMAKKINEL